MIIPKEAIPFLVSVGKVTVRPYWCKSNAHWILKGYDNTKRKVKLSTKSGDIRWESAEGLRICHVWEDFLRESIIRYNLTGQWKLEQGFGRIC